MCTRGLIKRLQNQYSKPPPSTKQTREQRGNQTLCLIWILTESKPNRTIQSAIAPSVQQGQEKRTTCIRQQVWWLNCSQCTCPSKQRWKTQTKEEVQNQSKQPNKDWLWFDPPRANVAIASWYPPSNYKHTDREQTFTTGWETAPWGALWPTKFSPSSSSKQPLLQTVSKATKACLAKNCQQAAIEDSPLFLEQGRLQTNSPRAELRGSNKPLWEEVSGQNAKLLAKRQGVANPWPPLIQPQSLAPCWACGSWMFPRSRHGWQQLWWWWWQAW